MRLIGYVSDERFSAIGDACIELISDDKVFILRSTPSGALYGEGQLHDGTLDLDRYRVLVIHTHPEYWSRKMYTRVKQWVFERGGRLVYLGGNGLDCEVELLDPSTLRFRTEDEDPEGPFENRMHRSFEPTAALLG